jgi:IclR family transcriptional regulator, KDG regulon repressor
MPRKEGNGVQSVDRALALLGYIAGHPESKPGLQELADYLELDKSSAFRLLASLTEAGLARQDEGKKGYQLGYGIFTLAAALREQSKLTELASPSLRRLAQASRENAHLAVLSGTRAVFIDRERATKTIAANTNIGDNEDLYCTAVGKCLICDLDEARLAALFSGLEFVRYTERTVTDLGALEEELVRVRAEGYAVDREEYEANVVCLAAPIYNFEGRIEAAIGISGPRERLDSSFAFLLDEVRRAGRDVSTLLGGGRAAG